LTLQKHNQYCALKISNSRGKSPDFGCFVAHPYSAPTKILYPEPSTTPIITVKYTVLGD
jgi:hypothetical protein